MKIILIIDDDDGFRRLLEKSLSRRGYQVHSAADGKSGLRWFDAVAPDVVITDIFMPDKDGLEVISTLAKAGQARKVIAVSGMGDVYGRMYLDMARMMNVAYTFDKPVDLKKLYAAIDEITNSEVPTADMGRSNCRTCHG